METIKSIGFLTVVYTLVYSRYVLGLISLLFFIRGLYLKIKNKDSEKAFNMATNFFIATFFSILLLPFLVTAIGWILSLTMK